MSKHVLLIEPYDVVADILTDILADLGFEVDVVSSGKLKEEDLFSKDYDCVFINLDQNSARWRDKGLKFAEAASNAGLPVVMIPDHNTAAATIEANGWLHLQKPFTTADIDRVIAKAEKEKSREQS